MKRQLKTVGVALATTSLILTACGSNADSGSKDKKTINLSFTSDPPTLNPGLSTDTTSAAVADNLFEGLTRVAKDGKADLAGAESVEKQEDGRVWIFKLRKDAKWSNGDAVTAKDYVYAWKWVLNPANQSESAYKLYDIKGAEAYNGGKGKAEDVAVEAVDDTTLKVTLTSPVQYFDQVVTNASFFPVNQKVSESDAKWYTKAETFVSNGAFKLASYSPNKEVVLTKSDTYYDKANVDLDEVKINIVSDETTAFSMYNAGELDAIGDPYNTIATDAMDQAKKSPEYKASPKDALYMYKFNTEKDFVKNQHIRRALSYAINRQEIVDNITKAGQQPAAGFVPSFDSKLFKDHDVEAAKKELELGMKELGITNVNDIKLTISYNTSEGHAKIAQAIQEQWKQALGINAELSNAEWKVYLDQMHKGDLQVMRAGWSADYSDATNYLNMFASVENGDNNTGWYSDEYTNLLNKAKEESDAAKREELLKSAEKIIVEEAPIAPLYYYVTPSVVKENVKGFEQTPLGNVYLKDVKIEKK